MVKAELVSQLENAKNNYVLGMAAISLFASPEAYPILDDKHASFGQYSIRFSQVSALLRNANDREIGIREFLTSQIRALIKESFESKTTAMTRASPRPLRLNRGISLLE